jgi:hypothetical protein
MTTFKVGQKVFIPALGKTGIIASLPEIPAWSIGKTVPFNCLVLETVSNTAYQIKQSSDIEPICDEVFKVGDKIESILGGGFTGEVTGFELEVNRVISKSDKSSTSRTRWSYGIQEVQAFRKEYTFYLNAEYKVNHSFKVRVIESPMAGVRFLLVNESGLITAQLESEKIDWKILKAAGINTLDRIHN